MRFRMVRFATPPHPLLRVNPNSQVRGVLSAACAAAPFWLRRGDGRRDAARGANSAEGVRPSDGGARLQGRRPAGGDGRESAAAELGARAGRRRRGDEPDALRRGRARDPLDRRGVVRRRGARAPSDALAAIAPPIGGAEAARPGAAARLRRAGRLVDAPLRG